MILYKYFLKENILIIFLSNSSNQRVIKNIYENEIKIFFMGYFSLSAIITTYVSEIYTLTFVRFNSFVVFLSV